MTATEEVQSTTVESEQQKETPEKLESDKEPESTKNIDELVAQGKRNLLCREIPKAVNDLEEACGLLADKFGETAPECANPLLLYGTALLELVRMESGVLGNALDGVPSAEEEETEDKNTEESTEMTAEEKEKLSDDIIDAMAEKEKDQADSEMKSEEKETAEEEKKDDEKPVETKEEDKSDEKETEEKAQDEKEEEEAGGDEEEGDEDVGETSQDEEKKEEDVSNIQLAWEMCDLARVIFSKQDTKEAKLKVADCRLKLGEISLEADKYDEALGDMRECLKIQQELLDADDRRLAETNYQIGLTYNMCKKFDEGVDSLKSAAKIIEDRMANLEKKIGSDAEEKEKDDSKLELDELKEILPDIKSKIEDSEDEKKHYLKSQETVGETQVGFGSSSSSSTTTENAPASNISHLIRKKRKPEDEEEQTEDQDAKKPKVSGEGDSGETEAKENGVHAVEANGDHKTNGTNGVESTNGTNGVESSNGTTEEVIKTKTVQDVTMEEKTEETTA